MVPELPELGHVMVMVMPLIKRRADAAVVQASVWAAMIQLGVRKTPPADWLSNVLLDDLLPQKKKKSVVAIGTVCSYCPEHSMRQTVYFNYMKSVYLWLLSSAESKSAHYVEWRLSD